MLATRSFDIVSPEFHANPFPTLHRMRAEAPVVRLKLPIIGRTWLAVTHDACATLLKDHETFARDPGQRPGALATVGCLLSSFHEGGLEFCSHARPKLPFNVTTLQRFQWRS